jgi:hypothetical protein
LSISAYAVVWLDIRERIAVDTPLDA